jgi:hypothetical protein
MNPAKWVLKAVRPRVAWWGAAAILLSSCGQAGASGSTTAAAVPMEDEWVVATSPSIASSAHPVVWFRDYTDDHLLVAFDWSGRAVGSMRVRASEPFGALQSPDGTALVLLHAQPSSGGTVVGHTKGQVSWARDSSHLCAFLTQGGDVYQPTLTPATPPAPPGEFIGYGAIGALFIDTIAPPQSRRIETFGTFGDHGGPTVLACSIPDARAIVGNTFVATTSQVHAINLNTDASVGAPGFGSQTGNIAQGIVASADGRLVGLGSTAGIGWEHNSFIIRAVDTGGTLASLPGAIVAFSDDDSRVLTVAYLASSNGSAGRYSLIDWRSGHVVWSAELNVSTAVVRPGTGDMLLEPWTYRPVPGANRSQPFTVPLVVHADGSTIPFAAELRPVDF